MSDVCGAVGDVLTGLFGSGAATDAASAATDAAATGAGDAALSSTDLGLASTAGALDAFASGSGGLGSDVGGNAVSSSDALAALNTPIAGASDGSPTPSSSGILSKLNPLSLLSGTGSGSGKGISGTALALGVLSALGSMGNRQTPRPGPASTAATQGPLFNTPLNTTSSLNRTPVSFASTPASSWYTYGQQPEPLFFNNNALNFATTSPTGSARGGPFIADPHEDVEQSGDMPGAGFHGYVPGGDPGQADTQDAKLSHGEFVFDAQSVANAGDGNNAAGARRLEHMRRAIASDKGIKSVVPPKLKKSPLQYLQDAP